MSVLKAKRHESAAEYVNVADEIYTETMGFLARLSNRYQRLLAQDAMKLASNVLDHAEMANSIFVTDDISYEARRAHLIEARASVVALDVHMSHIWRLMMTNPQGCFTDTKGRIRTPSEAIAILEKMAVSLGEKIDKEKNLLSKVMSSDKEKHNGGCDSG